MRLSCCPDGQPCWVGSLFPTCPCHSRSHQQKQTQAGAVCWAPPHVVCCGSDCSYPSEAFSTGTCAGWAGCRNSGIQHLSWLRQGREVASVTPLGWFGLQNWVWTQPCSARHPSTFGAAVFDPKLVLSYLFPIAVTDTI